MNFNILSINLNHLTDLTVKTDYYKNLFEYFAQTQADIIFLQEVKEEYLNSLEDYFLSHLHHVGNFTHVRGSMSMILSKFEMCEIEKFHLIDDQLHDNSLLLVQVKIKEKTIDEINFYMACVCFHFSFFNIKDQYSKLSALIEKKEKVKNTGLIIAGNFYDWSQGSFEEYEKALCLQEVFKNFSGEYARNYPSNVPLFCLDRIYIKKFQIINCEVLYNVAQISHHLPLLCQLRYNP